MTYFLTANFAMDLLLAVTRKVTKEIPEVKQWSSIGHVSENSLQYGLHYALPEHSAFCSLHISVKQDEPRMLEFAVDADYLEVYLEDKELHKIDIGDLMSRYKHLLPFIKKEVVYSHDFSIDGKTNPHTYTGKSVFKVKYWIADEIIEESTARDNYCFDEMASKILPYIKSLHEIFKVLHPNHENLKVGMI